MKKRKEFVSGSILLCVVSALGICVAMPLSASEPAKVQERAFNKNVEDEDSCKQEARQLVAKGDYAGAIKVLKDVIEPMRDEASKIDSWRLRSRLVEFEDELRRIEVAYANAKLKQAEAALNSGRYDDAISLASEANQISETASEQAMQLIVAARGRKNAADRKAKAAAKSSDPEIEKRERDIKRKLAEAHAFYRNGKYDKAWEKIEEIYVLNPYNADAAYLASQVYKKFYVAGFRRRNADVQAQMAYEAWQWVEPVFPTRGSLDAKGPASSIVKEDNDYAIQKKLDEIVFPRVNFENANLESVVKFMRNNKSFDPDKEGVTITLIQSGKKPVKKAEEPAPAANEADGLGGEGGENDDFGGEDDWMNNSGDANQGDNAKAAAQKEGEGIFVTLHLRRVTLRQLLDYVCFLTDLTYVIRDNRVFFGAEDASMISREYDAKESMKVMIAGRKGVAAPAAAQAAEEAPAEAGGAEDDFGAGFGEDDGGEPAADDVADDPGAGDGGEKSTAGAAVAPPKPQPTVDDKDLTPEALKNFFSLYGVEFPEKSSISFYRGKIIMNNTEANHRRMAELIKRLNVEKPMIEVEVKSIELAESDMEELGFHWALGDLRGGGRTGGKWGISKGSNTRDNGDGMLKMLNAALSGVDSKLISNLNIFPDLFGSFKPFGSDVNFNLTLTINALDRSDRTEQISAPRVLVANNATAQVKMTKAYFFPEDWEELEIEMEEVGDSGNYAFDITYPSPEFSESESDIGTVFTVTPTILDGNKTIRLNLNPRITAYTGKDEYEVMWTTWGADGKNEEEHRVVVWRPVIATREVKVVVDVNHGETLVIGGLSDSQTQKRLDKIPILADIPFIGRLFQSQSEISTRRNMLIFVTARLVNNDGTPLPMVDNLGNGGIPMLMR